jgi:hypothetical protein
MFSALYKYLPHSGAVGVVIFAAIYSVSLKLKLCDDGKILREGKSVFE